MKNGSVNRRKIKEQHSLRASKHTHAHTHTLNICIYTKSHIYTQSHACVNNNKINDSNNIFHLFFSNRIWECVCPLANVNRSFTWKIAYEFHKILVIKLKNRHNAKDGFWSWCQNFERTFFPPFTRIEITRSCLLRSFWANERQPIAMHDKYFLKAWRPNQKVFCIIRKKNLHILIWHKNFTNLFTWFIGYQPCIYEEYACW